MMKDEGSRVNDDHQSEDVSCGWPQEGGGHHSKISHCHTRGCMTTASAARATSIPLSDVILA